VLFDELSELTGQRNAIDGRIVDIIAEIDGDRLWGNMRQGFAGGPPVAGSGRRDRRAGIRRF
jgi:hypothetical protein